MSAGPLAERCVVLGVTGSIASYKAAEVASRLVQAGATVEVAMTPSATQFVTPLTFRSLTGREPYVELFAPGGETQTLPLKAFSPKKTYSGSSATPMTHVTMCRI